MMKNLLLYFFLVLYNKRYCYSIAYNGDTAMDGIIDANKGIEESFIEGDIPIIQDGTIDKKYNMLWPNGVVPYTFDSSFPTTDRQSVRAAVRLIENAARCLRFIEYSSNPPQDHVSVFRGSGCWSMIGRQKGRQQLSLDTGCMDSGIIVHEFLHAIGFYHEQSRPDRDQYVRINYQNIQSGREHNFQTSDRINSMQVEYDPVSVMHYSKNAFSKNGQSTIEWIGDPNKKLGGSQLSGKDKQQLNLLYCRQNPPTTTRRPVIIGGCSDKSVHCRLVQEGKRRCSGWYAENCPRSCNICTGMQANKCNGLKDRYGACNERSNECSTNKMVEYWCAKTCCQNSIIYINQSRLIMPS